MRLTCASNIDSGSTATPVSFEYVVRKPYLDVALDLPPLRAEGGILSKTSESSQFVEVPDPAVTDLAGHQGRLFGIAHGQPAPRRHPIRDVDKLLWPHLVEIVEEFALQQFGMKLSHSVDLVASDAGEIGHANIFLVMLVNDRHARNPRLVAGETLANLLQKPRINFVDDFQVARQQRTE